MQSKNAIGNLVNRYKSVLEKCNLLNAFGSLAFVGMLTASLGLSANMLIPENAGAFTPPTGDYFTAEEVQAGESYLSTFSITENNVTTEYGFLYKDPVNGTTSGSIGIVIPELKGSSYTISTNITYPHGHVETLDFTVDGTTYYIDPSIASEARIASLAGSVGQSMTPLVFYLHEPSSGSTGGAIFNLTNLPDAHIYADFFKNNVNRGSGGAIFNQGTMGNITGDFIVNTAAAGGAILNTRTIGDITGDFIANATTDGAGGAINNNSTMGNIKGDFIANTADQSGGAIYNQSTMGDINANFINNTASATGGAIATLRDLTFLADTQINIFSGNRDSTGSNAIHVSGNNTLSFNMAGNGGFLMNDGISGNTNYTVAISGDPSANNVFYLNNSIDSNGSVTLHDATLQFGSSTQNNQTYHGSVQNLSTTGTSIISGNAVINGTANIDDTTNINGIAIFNGNTTFTDAILRTTNLYSSNNIYMASASFLHNLPNNIDGNIIVEQNSYTLLGGDSANYNRAYAESAFGTSSHNWGTGVTAALFIVNPQILESTGSIKVNGANTELVAASVNNADFAANSLLVVDSTGLGNNAALTANNGTLTVASAAKLHIKNATNGTTLKIVDGFTNASSIAANAWDDDNLSISSSLQVVEAVDFDPTTGTYSVEISALPTPNPNPNPSGVDILLQTYPALTPELAELMVYFSQTSPDVNSQITYHKLFSRIFDSNYIGIKDPFLVAKTLTSIFNIGSSSATVQNAFATTKGGVNTMLSRLGFASADFGDNVQIAYSDNSQENLGISSGSDMAKAMPNGFAAWLMPLYSHTHASGFESGVFQSGYTSDLGGLTLGGDYTFQNKYRLGLAINAGGGSSNSNGDFNETSNDFNFIGVSLYGSAHWDSFALIADMGYTHVDNEISQDLPSVLGMNDVEADITNEIFTIGLTGEYTFNLKDIEITPHVGIRYTHAATNAYDASIDGATIVHTKSDSQDIFTIPVGVSVSKDFITQTGYVITPKADVGVIASFGELESTSISSIPNVAGTSHLSMDTVDNLAFSGGFGLEVAKENFSLDLNYTLQASSHETSHGVFANFRYKF